MRRSRYDSRANGVLMRELIVILLLSSAVGGSACRQPAGEDQGNSQSNAANAWAVKIEPVNAPSGPNSNLPRLTASERGIILSWVERVGATAHLKFAERTSSGWSEPGRVASGDNWFLSYADPPTVLRRPDGTLVANWLISTNPSVRGFRSPCLIFAGQRKDMGASIHAAPRRHGAAACLCLVFRAARKPPRSELARRARYPAD